MKKLLGLFLLLIGLAHLGAFYLVSDAPVFYQNGNQPQVKNMTTPSTDHPHHQNHKLDDKRFVTATTGSLELTPSETPRAAKQKALHSVLVVAGLGLSAWLLSRGLGLSLPGSV